MTKKQLPANIESQVKRYHEKGFGSLPPAYISWHMTQAKIALQSLDVIAHKKWMVSDNGMRLLQAIVEKKNGELYKLRWNDQAQEFYAEVPGGHFGWVRFY